MGLKIVRRKRDMDSLAVCTIYGFVCTVVFAKKYPKEIDMGTDKKLATKKPTKRGKNGTNQGK